MSRIRKSLVVISMLILSLSATCICASAAGTADVAKIGTDLMNTLLERQYESFIDGSECVTSDIMTESESNIFYKQFLNWYSGSSQALGETWTEYDYTLKLEEINGNNLSFSNNVEYWVKDCPFEWSNSDVTYEITVDKNGEKYFITDITTTAGDYNDFKRLIEGKRTETISLGEKVVSVDSFVKELVEDSKKLKIAIENNKVEEKDVVNMEQRYQEYLSNANNEMSTRGSYSYDGERGRQYADLYAESRNTCFYYVDGNDCTNFVSQCIWAAYGGWTSGDNAATMTNNINNKKRMQSSASLSNWFAGSGGGGTPWESVTGLWNFLNTSNSTGPRATKHNNNALCTNIYPGDILTGQVLQVRYGSSGSYGHSVYVAGGVNDSFSNIRVAQHTDNRIRSLANLVNAWGGNSNCYLRQLKFQTANFDR